MSELARTMFIIVLTEIKKSGNRLMPRFTMFEYSVNEPAGMAEIYVSYHSPANGDEWNPHPHGSVDGCCQRFEYSTKDKLVQNYGRMIRGGGLDYLKCWWLSEEEKDNRNPAQWGATDAS